MDKKYILSEHFTLIPAEYYSPQQGEAALKGQFALQGNHIFGRYDFEQANAVVAYAIPQENSGNEGGGQEENPVPLVAKLLELTNEIAHYNKVIFHYSSKKNISHIVIAAGNELKLANSFKADSFESALYFLFLAIKGLQMNPRQCTVRVCCGITKEQEEIFSRFFKGFQVNDLDILFTK